jgi:hypothetical protein
MVENLPHPDIEFPPDWQKAGVSPGKPEPERWSLGYFHFPVLPPLPIFMPPKMFERIAALFRALRSSPDPSRFAEVVTRKEFSHGTIEREPDQRRRD